jgi:NhaA family Na+:H+ antiporter
MHTDQSTLSRTFNNFFDSEKSSGILILFCTLVSMSIANSMFGEQYLNFWHIELLGLSIEHWVNDGLMAVFFLFIGLELER